LRRSRSRMEREQQSRASERRSHPAGFGAACIVAPDGKRYRIGAMIVPRNTTNHDFSCSPARLCLRDRTEALRRLCRVWRTGVKRRPRMPLLAAWTLCLVLVFQTCALPIPLAFLLISPNAKPMTAGCSQKTCCTALCYLDKKGIHHCVHMHDESCENNLSSHGVDPLPIIYSTAGTLDPVEHLFPVFDSNRFILQTKILAESNNPGIPSPPPKL